MSTVPGPGYYTDCRAVMKNVVGTFEASLVSQGTTVHKVCSVYTAMSNLSTTVGEFANCTQRRYEHLGVLDEADLSDEPPYSLVDTRDREGDMRQVQLYNVRCELARTCGVLDTYLQLPNDENATEFDCALSNLKRVYTYFTRMK
jgi:hypothetical protein